MVSDNGRADRVREELARRADLEQQRVAKESAYFRRLAAARSELPDMLRRAVLSATEFPVEIEQITSEPSPDDWEEGDEEGWEEEDAAICASQTSVEIAFYKLQSGHVVRVSVAEINVPSLWPTHGSDEPQAVVLDMRASAPPYIHPGARNLEEAVSAALRLVVNALADAIEAGCEIIPPAEGRRRTNEQDEQDEKRRLAEQALSSPNVEASPPAQRETISPWIIWLALAAFVLSIIFRLG